MNTRAGQCPPRATQPRRPHQAPDTRLWSLQSQCVSLSPDALSLVHHNAVIAGIYLLRGICKNPPAEAATSIALEQYRANVNLFSSLTLLLAQSNAFSQAAILVAASGNESDRPRYEIAVAPPAVGEGMISVGALQRSAAGNLSVATFSNTQCNLCGPGVSVTSAWVGNNDILQTINGTSMATPHVAGCAALWAQQQKQLTGTLTNDNLAAKTLTSATFLPGASFGDIGNGMVQAPQN